MPTQAASENEQVCDTRYVSDWLVREIFLPVVAEANASADGRLNATDAQGMLAVLNVHVGANITRAASNCSIIEVDSAMLKDRARAALHAEGVPTSRCEAHEDHVASLVSDLALHALNISTHGAFSVPFADILASVVSTAVGHYLVPNVTTNTGTCEATEALNATVQAAVEEFLTGPTFVGLWSSVLAEEAACAEVLALAQQAASLGILTDLNATASGTLNATHAAVLEGLVAQHVGACVSVHGLNCTDFAAVTAALDQRSLELMLAVSQHTLFQAHGAMPQTQRVVVAMTVRLAIPITRFDAAARAQYRAGVAAACTVDLAAVRITSVRAAVAAGGGGRGARSRDCSGHRARGGRVCHCQRAKHDETAYGSAAADGQRCGSRDAGRAGGHLGSRDHAEPSAEPNTEPDDEPSAKARRSRRQKH